MRSFGSTLYIRVSGVKDISNYELMRDISDNSQNRKNLWYFVSDNGDYCWSNMWSFINPDDVQQTCRMESPEWEMSEKMIKF